VWKQPLYGRQYVCILQELKVAWLRSFWETKGKENSTDCPNETENKNILLFFGEILDEKRKFVLITFLPRERENGTEHLEKKLDL
jgi:hypothetical protein